jgi:hypothetical protein
MTTATSQATISNTLGELIVNDCVWNCTITKEASSAISAIDWNGEVMEITFRNSNNGDPYVYITQGSAVDDMLAAVESVLSGVTSAIEGSSTPASVGVVYNQLLKSQQLILV